MYNCNIKHQEYPKNKYTFPSTTKYIMTIIKYKNKISREHVFNNILNFFYW